MATRQQEAQEVVYQNRIDFLKAEHDRLEKSKDQLVSEIDRKTKDYELYMAQKDGESKRIRADVLASQEQLMKDKSEFQAILNGFKENKEQFPTLSIDFRAHSMQIERTDRKKWWQNRFCMELWFLFCCWSQINDREDRKTKGKRRNIYLWTAKL